jgi:drug/metabolite transporter (DMT)-like permease
VQVLAGCACRLRVGVAPLLVHAVVQHRRPASASCLGDLITALRGICSVAGTVAGVRQVNVLPVAVAAFLVGGFGNVAFSAHSGSVAALILLRFAFGALLAAGFMVWRRPPRPELRTVRRPKLWLSVSAACESGAVVLLIAASQFVSTLVFTLVGLAGTAVLALVGRWLSLGSGTRGQALAAAGALAAAAASVLVSGDLTEGRGSVGVGLALASTGLGLLASLSGSFAASVRHPGEIVRVMSLWGCGWAGLLVLTGAEFTLTWSTVAAASFIAVLPGGLGKAAVFWALARTAPYLVSACSSVALLTAALGGWLVLGEVPRFEALVFAGVAGAMVAVLNLLTPRTPPVTRPEL